MRCRPSASPGPTPHRRRLQEIAAARAAEFVARGATGHPLLWEQERVAVLADLNTMLTDDNAWRRERDAAGRGQRIDLRDAAASAPVASTCRGAGC